MVLGATVINISAISWRSGLLEEENHRPVSNQGQTLAHNVVSCTPRHELDSNSRR